MSLLLYMDAHVPAAVIDGLRRRGIDCLTAQEDNAEQLDDTDLLTRATAAGRALFTQDKDFLIEAARRQQAGEHFAGIIFSPQLNTSIGQMVKDLEVVAQVYDPSDMVDCVEYLPL